MLLSMLEVSELCILVYPAFFNLFSIFSNLTLLPLPFKTSILIFDLSIPVVSTLLVSISSSCSSGFKNSLSITFAVSCSSAA